MPKRNWTRWCKWATIGTALVLIAVVVAGWMLFQHIPDWYRPIEIPPDLRDAVRADCINASNSLSQLLNDSQKPFDFRLEQDRVNSWLWMAAQGEIWPRWKRALPAGVQDPHVVFGPDAVRLAISWRRGSVRTVFNARLALGADAEGIRARLLEVAAGSLPIPRSKVQQLLATLDGQVWPAGKPAQNQIGNKPLPALAGLYDGIVLPNTWIWPNGRPPFKVTKIALRAGEATLTLEPLPRQAGGRPGPSSDDSPSPIWSISPGPASAGSR